MTALPEIRARLRREVSGQTLFYGALLLSLALAAAFCFTVWSAAERAERQMVENVANQMLGILEESGVSGLAAAYGKAQRISLPGTDRLEFALWQVRGQTRRVIMETTAHAADMFGEGGERAKLGDTEFALHSVDVAGRSGNWTLPMQDAALVFGIAQPTAEMSRAVRQIWTILAISFFVCALMVVLQIVHWQRYRRSLQRINMLLERYSDGETGIRFEDETPAPELRELGRQLNVALPKIDGLFADLRTLSAHLAHELRTPLQTIRSGLRKIVREDDADQRAGIARGLDQGIDSADARLQTVMQLFRLQADAEVKLDAGVGLGDLLEDLIYDFEEDLLRKERTLDIQIDKTLTVTGNPHLLELMISNLLSNAAKYAPVSSDICVSLVADQGRFQLRVENDGTLPKGLSDLAFDRFTQGNEHRSETGFGLGLGLVRAIAKKHGYSSRLIEEKRPDEASTVVAIIEGEIEHD